MGSEEVDSIDVGHLLYELCVNLGYCLPPADQRRLVEAPPSDVDSFTDAVLIAEGLDPELNKQGRRAVRDLVAKHFGEEPTAERRIDRRARRDRRRR